MLLSHQKWLIRFMQRWKSLQASHWALKKSRFGFKMQMNIVTTIMGEIYVNSVTLLQSSVLTVKTNLNQRARRRVYSIVFCLVECGYFKGMEQILQEHLLISDGQTLKASCRTSLNKCPPGRTDCCCQRMLYSQPDFMEQKSTLEELIEGAGHLILFYPKFHCELNFIGQYWGNANF